jgi:tetratricopeptide (TPR) repeat protein
MKALEKDRTRRYETASGLAADVRRFLSEEPVEARPPSAWYRFRKFARRNRRAVFLGLLALATVVAVLFNYTIGYLQIRKERDRALAAEQQAVAEKANAQAALRFLLSDVLEQADPSREPDRDLKVRTLLDRAASRLEEKKGMPPLVEAAIRQTMGRIYLRLWELGSAGRQLLQAYTLQREYAGEDHPDTLTTANYVAWTYCLERDFSKAEPLFLRVLDGRRRLLGDDHPETLQAMHHLGILYVFWDEPDRAEPLFVKALQTALRVHGDREPATLALLHGLGGSYLYQGRYAEAEPLLEKALEGFQTVMGERHSGTLRARRALAMLYLDTRRLAQAERQASETYPTMRAVLGDLHADTLSSQWVLATVYLEQGRRAEAEPLLREFREKCRLRQDYLPPFVLWGMIEVGEALLRQRDFTEAESFLRLYLDLEGKKPPDSWRWSAAVSALGACLLGQEKYAEAEPLLLGGYQGLRQHEQRIPAAFRCTRLAKAAERLVQLYEAWGKPDETTKWRKELEAIKAAGRPTAGP